MKHDCSELLKHFCQDGSVTATAVTDTISTPDERCSTMISGLLDTVLAIAGGLTDTILDLLAGLGL